MTAGDLDTGARIGRYVIVERVGTGAMGVVYGAYDPELDRKVALKLIKPGQGVRDTARARLLREAKAIARLQHPNVVAVHDVGVFEDQVFLAMEFVAGGTIKSWLSEKPRTWREIVDVFVAAGRGLAAAHAAGLVHRDFKPDNVLLDKEGRPRVVDFGIARQAGAGDDELAGDTGDVDGTATLRDSSGKHALATVTKTGTWVGTPAYMAPEQFLGERGDEKSDQFSFCVALYEALYGERPFAGDDMLSISVNVTTEQFRPLPKDRGIPAWVRRVIMRGLRVDAAGRWESMGALIRALESDPAVKLRRRLITCGVIAAGAATAIVLIGAWQGASRRRAELDRQIASHVEAGRSVAVTARAKTTEARDLRQRAFAAFDAMKLDDGEALWRRARALFPAIDADFDQAERSFEAAITLDRSRRQVIDELADVQYEHLAVAEDFRLQGKADVLRERLRLSDVSGDKRRTLSASGTLELRVAQSGVRAQLDRYERDPATGRRTAVAMRSIAAPQSTTALPSGTYRLNLEGPSLARVSYPFEVRRGERAVVDLSMPVEASVPKGFAYIPPGEFWYGDVDEQLRTQFLRAVPIHRRRTGGYLIAQHETTYREWIAFLNALSPSERRVHTPQVTVATRGSVSLTDAPEGWQFSFQTSTLRYVAAFGEPLRYREREKLSRQDWLNLPVAGVSSVDAESYFAWLRKTGQVPGARFCTELEWERAARGADDRLLPHGDELEGDEANFDATYGRLDAAYGPDAVGMHPASRSPFGIDDMAGNLFEFVVSSQKADEMVLRGGAYYFGAATCRVTNREPVTQRLRDVTTGVRVCASIEGKQL